MNFKLIIFLASILVTACGVKGDPSAPAGTHLPSYLDNYDDINMDGHSKPAAKKP